jgi:DnaJ-class molecular chaperone
MNYYQILGIELNASFEDIKKKYRDLARIYHPDKNNGNDTKFKEIKTAYEELIDPEKRRIYDLRLRIEDNPFVKNFNNINLNDVKNMDFMSLGGLMSSFMFGNNKPTTDEPIPNIVYNFMKMYHNKNSKNETKSHEINMAFSFNDAYKNKVKKIKIDNQQFLIPLDRRVYEINNYKFKIHIKDDKLFKVIDDYDIELDLEISLYEALFKKEFYFSDPFKNNIKITINKSILNNNEFKIENMGLPKKNETRGDLYINFIIDESEINQDFFKNKSSDINKQLTNIEKIIKIN